MHEARDPLPGPGPHSHTHPFLFIPSSGFPASALKPFSSSPSSPFPLAYLAPAILAFSLSPECMFITVLGDQLSAQQCPLPFWSSSTSCEQSRPLEPSRISCPPGQSEWLWISECHLDKKPWLSCRRKKMGPERVSELLKVSAGY